MNKLLKLIIIITLLGCVSKTQRQVLSISNGMEYSKAKIFLKSGGMKESTSAWDMMIPDNIILHTYIIEDNKALLIDEEKDTGKILAMSIYGNIDKPKVHRTYKDISKYEIK